MIYKKIISKIPAISSLFLAGLFLPGKSTCCSDDKDKKAQQPQQQQTPNPGSGNGDTTSIDNGNDDGRRRGEGSNGTITPENQSTTSDPYIVDAVKDFKQFLFKISGIEYLGKSDRHLIHYHMEDFVIKADKKTDNKAKVFSKLEGYIKSLYDENMSALCYPPKLVKGCFEHLEKVVNNKKYEEYPCAYANAIQTITGKFKDLREVYSKVIEEMKQPGSKTQMNDCVKKIDELVSQSNECFISGKSFSDSPATGHQILDGVRMARFLLGISKKGTRYNDVSRILGAQIVGEIWLKFKLAAKAIPDASSVTTPPDQVLLDTRGAGTKNWKIEGGSVVGNVQGSDEMLPIPCIKVHQNAGSNQLLHHLNLLDTGDEDGVDSATGTNPSNLIITITSAQNTPATQNDEAAFLRTTPITFSQLLFTLFKGNSPSDFLRLQVGKKNNTVKLITNQSAYADWVTLTAGNPDLFAQRLYEHINQQTGLQDLFVIPDLCDIQSKILDSTSDGEQANDNATKIGAGTHSRTIIKNVIQTFSQHQRISSDNDRLLKKFEELASLANDTDFQQSDAPFVQHLCARIAKSLTNPDKSLLLDTGPQSSTALRKAVSDIIKKESDKVILRLNNGIPVATPVTKQIISSLQALDNQLKLKLKSASITYQTIESIASPFSIEKVREVFQDDCAKLKAIIQANVESVILRPFEGPGKVEYADYLDSIEALNPSYYRKIDEIIQGYHQKKNPSAKAAASTEKSDNKKSNDKNAGSNQRTAAA